MHPPWLQGGEVKISKIMKRGGKCPKKILGGNPKKGGRPNSGGEDNSPAQPGIFLNEEQNCTKIQKKLPAAGFPKRTLLPMITLNVFNIIFEILTQTC